MVSLLSGVHRRDPGHDDDGAGGGGGEERAAALRHGGGSWQLAHTPGQAYLPVLRQCFGSGFVYSGSWNFFRPVSRKRIQATKKPHFFKGNNKILGEFLFSTQKVGTGYC